MASSSSSHVSFAKPTADAHSSLAEKTAGLVTKDEFTRRREELEREAGEGEAGGSSGDAEPDYAVHDEVSRLHVRRRHVRALLLEPILVQPCLSRWVKLHVRFLF